MKFTLHTIILAVHVTLNSRSERANLIKLTIIVNKNDMTRECDFTVFTQYNKIHQKRNRSKEQSSNLTKEIMSHPAGLLRSQVPLLDKLLITEGWTRSC